MSKDLMFQCRLRKENREDVAWIEARGAKVGAVVEIKNGEERDPGWEVLEVYQPGKPSAEVHENARSWKNHRSRTDI